MQALVEISQPYLLCHPTTTTVFLVVIMHLDEDSESTSLREVKNNYIL